jgi:hypothetical protein
MAASVAEVQLPQLTPFPQPSATAFFRPVGGGGGGGGGGLAVGEPLEPCWGAPRSVTPSPPPGGAFRSLTPSPSTATPGTGRGGGGSGAAPPRRAAAPAPDDDARTQGKAARSRPPRRNTDPEQILRAGFVECARLVSPALCARLANLPMEEAEGISNGAIAT